ncbi:MAG: hypothetical protein HY000_24745, partial [Planctomycetes bacterium]|nr:hypothetical protein [Planctomycetota bacterium]
DGNLSVPSAGSPQGGVISPVLANVYLHYVLDDWFEREVKPRLVGRAFLIQYADDFVMGFTCEADARRVLDVLPKRFGKYGLTIHPEKTRLVPFRRPSGRPVRTDSAVGTQPGTFDLLGFTHYWGLSRNGNWVVKRQTAASRLRRAIRTIAQWCRIHRHEPIGEQHQTLSRKLRGHFAYYGITCNAAALHAYRDAVVRSWRKWLSRRSRRADLAWPNFNRLLAHYALPLLAAVRALRFTDRRNASSSASVSARFTQPSQSRGNGIGQSLSKLRCSRVPCRRRHRLDQRH